MWFLKVANAGVIFQTLLTHTFSHLRVDASFSLFSVPAHRPLPFLSDSGGEVCDLCIFLWNSAWLNFFLVLYHLKKENMDCDLFGEKTRKEAIGK